MSGREKLRDERRAEALGYARGWCDAREVPVPGTTPEADGAVLFAAAYGHAVRQYNSLALLFLPSVQVAFQAWAQSGGASVFPAGAAFGPDGSVPSIQWRLRGQVSGSEDGTNPA